MLNFFFSDIISSVKLQEKYEVEPDENRAEAAISVFEKFLQPNVRIMSIL